MAYSHLWNDSSIETCHKRACVFNPSLSEPNDDVLVVLLPGDVWVSGPSHKKREERFPALGPWCLKWNGSHTSWGHTIKYWCVEMPDNIRTVFSASTANFMISWVYLPQVYDEKYQSKDHPWCWKKKTYNEITALPLISSCLSTHIKSSEKQQLPFFKNEWNENSFQCHQFKGAPPCSRRCPLHSVCTNPR